MKTRSAAAVAFFLGCALATGAMATAKIEKIEPASPSVTLEGGKATVKFTIGGSSDDKDNCGFWVDYADGDSPDTRVLNRSEGLLPRVMEHTFTKPGTYTVKVKGQRVKTTLGCNGEASGVVNIVVPGGAKAAPAAKAATATPLAPNCPDGWQLQAKSVDKKTGAFACASKLPENKLECGPGLTYYQTATALGCRKGK
ncbi:MAG: hypothetical protein FJY55_10735 [Betaproteobacteria bacterium]|nr:hypothetical protein [Betaproteobacteria bacterium]